MAAKPWNLVPLVLPVDGKEYVVQPIGYKDGLTLIATFADQEDERAKGISADAEDEVLYRHCMGAAWDQMLEDGCPFPVLSRAGAAAVQYQTSLVMFDQECAAAVELAEKVWAEGLDPEAVAAYVAAKAAQEAAKPKTTSKRSTSTAAAAATPSPASTSGTRSRPATPRSKSSAARAKAPRSSGARSSTAGRSS